MTNQWKTPTEAPYTSYTQWFTNTPVNGSGVWFASAPISSGNNQRYVTKVFSEGDLNANLTQTSNPSAPLPFWRAHITPQNLQAIVQDINNWHWKNPDGTPRACTNMNCPPRPPGGYSTNPGAWFLEYAGVITEATVVRDLANKTYDASRTSWGGDPDGPTRYADTSKDQMALAVHFWAPSVYRYYP